MKRNVTSRAVRVTVLIAAGMSTGWAADSPAVPWASICRVAGTRELTITTQEGKTVQGYCTSINVTAISVADPNGRVVKIARSALGRIRVRRAPARGHALASLGRGMRAGLGFGLSSLSTPAAPLGLITLPGTLVWGAAAAPFCLIGDLQYWIGGSKEIKVI